MTSTKQAKIKTKHKFWTISILKSKGEKKEGKKWSELEESGKRQFQARKSTQRLHKHEKACRMRTQMRLKFYSLGHY